MQAKHNPLGLRRDKAADHHFDHARQSSIRPGANHLGPQIGRDSDAQRHTLDQGRASRL